MKISSMSFAVLAGVATILLIAIYTIVILVSFNDANKIIATKTFTNAVFWTLLVGIPLILFSTLIYLVSKSNNPDQGTGGLILTYFLISFILIPVLIVIGISAVSSKNEPHLKKVTDQKKELYSDEKKLEKISLLRDEVKKYYSENKTTPKICTYGSKFAVINVSQDCNKDKGSFNLIDTGDFEIFLTEKAPSFDLSTTKEIYINSDITKQITYYKNDRSQATLEYK